MKIPLELSDDLRRGDMLHIRAVLPAVRELELGQRCSGCKRRTATHLIDRHTAPRPVCGDCAAGWRGLSPLARHQARNDWARRG
jgi:hypothetical protein